MWRNKIIPFIKSTSVSQKIRKTSTQLHKTKHFEQSDVNSLKVGQQYYGFVVKQIEDIPEFRITAYYLLHEKTKSQYLHLYRNDPNNVFSVNFRTTPMNSSGLPHILEHTVLCGSDLFPVRDPFFKMLNRSLATFMNAMTGSDYTFYPFSTQNYKDYKNLQKIYLDAVFRPLLKETDFMQEGWRLEQSNINDEKSDIIIKGVVYNEMKGAFSENDSILGQKIQNLILPDHTYGVVSGGDPREIPNLTWDDLKRFHVAHYHPSNARFYSYGNFPLLPSLKYINTEYLTKYAYSPMTHTEVPKQKRWTTPRQEHIQGRFDNMGEPIEKQNTITISLLLSDNTEIYETVLMHFLSELLLKGPNAPFYKALIEPNFSGGYTPSTGFDNNPRDCIFTVGIQKLKTEDFGRVIKVFDETIHRVVEKGFEPQHIESVLHRYELSLKHENSNFGLNLLFSVTPTWNHTENVVSALQINNILERLKAEMKNNPSYLQEMVKKYFKDNNHKLILTMSADKEYDTKLDKEEKKIIKAKVKGLSDSDKKQIHENCLLLLEEQQKPVDTHLLPTLMIEDINADIEKVDRLHVSIKNVQTQINWVNSNGIVYFKAVLGTNDLTPEQQMLLPLFCHVINKMGTNKMNYREFDSMVNRKTAGLNFSTHIGDSLFHLHTYEPGVYISSHCLEKNAESMWNLWNQIFTISKLEDVKWFQTLVQLYMANLTNGIADAGHIYAMQAASGLVSGSAYQNELLSGLHHIGYMRRLIGTSNYRAMLDEILNIAKIIFDKRKMRVALNISQEKEGDVSRCLENFILNLPENTNPLTSDLKSTYITGNVWVPTDAVNCEHHVLNVPVYYCSKAVLTAPYTTEDFAKLRILARLLTSKYLHPELREKQGAYGGGARILTDGVFSFFSYRDPRSLETLDFFDEAAPWVNATLDKLTDQDVFEAKLGVFQAVDHPVPPSQKGCEEFLKRVNPDIKQRHRANLMSVDKDALKEVSEKYLSDSNILNTAKVVIGPKNGKTDPNKRSHELWTVIDSV